MKNILIINPFSGQIGPNSFLIEFVEANLKLGNRITILYPKEDYIYLKLKSLGVNVLIVPFIGFSHINGSFTKILIRFIAEFKLIYYIIFNISLKQYSYCISNSELYSFSLVVLSKFTRIIIVVHSLSFTKYKFLNKLVFGIQSLAAQKYIAVSQLVMNQLLVNGVVKPIEILYNTIHLGKFKNDRINYSDSKINILSIIHPVPHKGAHHLIQIISELTKVEKNVHFTILGWNANSKDKVYKKLIEDQIESLKLTSFITLKENVVNVVDYFNKAGIFIHPSESESFGIVIAEAMASKLPVISFDVGAVSEIVDNNRSGYLVEPFNISEYVSKLLLLVENKRIRDTFGENGYDIILKKFNSKNLIKKIEKILN
jgi:glycosyltransferase involved in cell wall biosynthesis